MREFASSDKFFITGRGMSYAIDKSQLPEDLYDPCLLRGETVSVDGIVGVVSAVETFCIPRSPSSPYRHGFGITLKEIDG